MHKFIGILIVFGIIVVFGFFGFLVADQVGMPSETYQLKLIDKNWHTDDDGGHQYRLIFDFPDQGTTVTSTVYRDVYYSKDVGESIMVDVRLGRYSQCPYVTEVH